jgi:micrococcal nuclease
MWMTRLIQLFFFLLLVSVNCDAQQKIGNKQEGKIIAIVDGDTFDILIDGKPVRVRMNAIDAPEKKQDYYSQSKQALANLSFGKTAIIIEHGHDRYKRLIADLLVNNQNINYKMVELGMAWHFKKYSSDPQLAAIENLARKNRTGLWSMYSPTAPWDYRASRKHAKQ